MTKDEEIRMINEKLDFYVMEASDEEFDTEEVLENGLRHGQCSFVLAV